jgi:hypothetical protein
MKRCLGWALPTNSGHQLVRKMLRKTFQSRAESIEQFEITSFFC